MKAEPRNLEELFVYLKKAIIPVYQRNYSWKQEIVQQLLNDILEINKKSKNYKHFIGPIVSIIHNSENSSRIFIDGQQRITTILILLIALKNLVKFNIIKVNNKESFIKEIENRYLFNEFEKEEEKIKLRPYNNDKKNYLSLFDENFIDEDNCIVKNYLFLKNKIQKIYIEDNLNIDNFFNTIKNRIMFVDILLEANATDNAQDIFESLNSKGQDLTNTDLIRNLILMNKNENEQEEIYKKYWEKIENNCGVDNLDTFIKYWLIYKMESYDSKNSPKEKGTDIYKKFKLFSREKSTNLYELLDELLKFSNYYKIILNNEFERINIINELEIGVSYPFIFYMFDLKDRGIIDKNTIIEALKIIETYVFRRYICDYPTNILGSVFFNLKKDIGKINNSNFIDKLSYVLLSKTGNAYLPRDLEFINSLKNRNFSSNYKKPKIKFLFRELEQFNNKEIVNFDNLTLEHIMPQTINKDWKDYLGDNWEDIYNKYLWNLGNLTYTAYNNELYNKPYILKKEYYKNSSLFLNKCLPEEFKEKDIEERAENIAKLINKRWKLPITSISLEKKENYYTIYNDFTNKKLLFFKFLDIEYTEEKNSFLGMFKKIIEILLEDYDKKLMNLIKNNNYIHLRNYKFGKNDILINKEYNIHSNPMSANTIAKILRDLFEDLDLNEEDLKMYVK